MGKGHHVWACVSGKLSDFKSCMEKLASVRVAMLTHKRVDALFQPMPAWAVAGGRCIGQAWQHPP
eukprot:1161123-Pelagomonas_calceolata.AAC.4